MAPSYPKLLLLLSLETIFLFQPLKLWKYAHDTPDLKITSYCTSFLLFVTTMVCCLKIHVFSYFLIGDSTPPQINCPPNINSVTQCGTPNGQLTFQQPTGTDNIGTPSVQCSATNVQLTLQGSQYSGNFPANQQTTVTCTATDACQLSSRCTFIASVSGGKSLAFAIRTLCMLKVTIN